MATSGLGAGDASCVSRFDKPYLTTAEAAACCGFKTASALRKLKLEGKLAPMGWRGGVGTRMWSRQALNAFLHGRPPRDKLLVSVPSSEDPTSATAAQEAHETNGEECLEQGALALSLEELARRDSQARSVAALKRRLSDSRAPRIRARASCAK